MMPSDMCPLWTFSTNTLGPRSIFGCQKRLLMVPPPPSPFCKLIRGTEHLISFGINGIEPMRVRGGLIPASRLVSLQFLRYLYRILKWFIRPPCYIAKSFRDNSNAHVYNGRMPLQRVYVHTVRFSLSQVFTRTWKGFQSPLEDSWCVRGFRLR